MSRDQAHDDARITSADQLVAWFRSGSKGDAVLGVGTEHEKLGFDAETLAPIPYEGDRGIGRLLAELAERYGWEAYEDDGRIMALLRDGAAVTLEPGGQLELSGRVTRTIHETRDELAEHLVEVAEVAAELGQRWTHLGLNPWDRPDEIPWMPKSRYVVMRNYLGSRGALAHWMMKNTCTVQANYDYRDEADALRKLAVTSRLSPVVTALFAGTPVRAGQSGAASERMRIWEQVDPDRTGTPNAYLRGDAGFADIVEWCLDIPMLFVTRDGRYRDVAGTPFRALLEGRVEGLEATIGDWELHLSALFPDVRLKRYIEVRTADAGLPGHLLALPALWKGILYDGTALADAEALAGTLDRAGLKQAEHSAATQGLDGEFRGRRLRDVAADLIAIAGDGLDRQLGEDDDERGSERRYLAPLSDRDGVPRAPVDAFRALWEACEGDRATMIEAYELGIPA